jgi:hypothetical protein
MIFSSIAAPFFTEYIAKLAKKRHVKWGQLLRSEYKNSEVFMLGLYYPKNSFWRKVKCKKMLITFSGSDVISLRKMKKKDRNKLILSLENKGYKFASNGNFLKEEMEQMYDFKNKIEIIKLPSPHSFDVMHKMPDKFSVGIYMSQKNPIFYGYNVILEVMKELEDIDFYFYSGKGYIPSKEELSLNNFKYSKKAVSDMSGFLKKISCGVRVTDHDAACMSAVEYNMAGRWFIFNHEMRHCSKLSQKPSKEEVIEMILKIKEKGETLNTEGSEYYKRHHNIKNFLKKVGEII